VILIASSVAVAARAGDSPVGLWKTIDDDTGNERSLVRIVETDGGLQGKVERILTREPEDDPEDRCTACSGERRNQPVIGMTILWGMKREEGGRWAGGEILDPESGSIYDCSIEVVEEGRTLRVRGFLLFSLFGRSQLWHRVE
jgi:uncharacterized protein (DUF2147 family)